MAARYARVQLRAATDAVAEAAKARSDTERQHQEQLRHEEQVRREESDPYVAVFTRPLMVPGFFYVEFVIKNFGATAALDVAFSWDSYPRQCFHGDVVPVTFPDHIPYLAPGQEFSTLWDDGLKRLDSDLKDEDKHTVRVQYRRRVQSDVLSQECAVDWEPYRSMHYVEMKSVHSLTQEVEKLRKYFENLGQPMRVRTWDGEVELAKARQLHEELLRRRAGAEPDGPVTTGSPDEDASA